ncbi:hypothetical protein ET495_08920 [Xylanimonas allomyrinae]|uniref:O-antigen ligase-related domain-containing protein n=1 Tax=Xylanimonas allomyrinae TaxID=2509459 RepID=A0A4P6EKW3_9MICO|nr:O-antigen ligase family protein [Xylanimonas allomyrinae]QAY63350.1 hypothetical protein ET495_08920 [Xylanimonas allomyrinae]
MRPVLLAVAGLAYLVVLWSLHPRLQAWWLAFLMVPQVYLPGLPLTLAEATAAAVVVQALGRQRRAMSNRPVVAGAVVCALASLIAAAYSPDRNAALSTAFRFALFAGLIHASASLFPERSDRLRAMWALAPWIALEAALAIYFRARPEQELVFMRTRVADTIVGPWAAGLFDGQVNNVLDPLKSGGLFVNGNVASMFLGASMFFCLLLFRLSRRRAALFLACLSGVAAIATGSKTGAVLTVVLLVVAALLQWARTWSRLAFVLALLPLLLLIAVQGANRLERAIPVFGKESLDSLDSRLPLWRLVEQVFFAHPTLGLGYGGWQEAAQTTLPPHNLLIAAWANGGLLLLGGVLLTIGAVLRKCLQALGDARVPRLAGTAATCIFTWVFLHGMADNTAIYGESKTMILLVLALSWVTPARETSEEGPAANEPRSVVTDAGRRSLVPSLEGACV